MSWVCKERTRLPGLFECSINIEVDYSIVKINGEHNQGPLSELEIEVAKFKNALKDS